MTNLNIRPAKPEDWPIIQKLNAEVFANDRDHDVFINCDWPNSKAGQEYYRTVCSRPDKHFTVIAYVSGIPMGYLTASKKDLDYRSNLPLEINNMGVSPAHRSRGIGKLLIDHTKAWAKSNGYTHLYVEAYSQNTRAHNFYQKMGMTTTSISFEGKL